MFRYVYKKNIVVFSLIGLLALLTIGAMPLSAQLHADAQVATCPTFVAGIAQNVAMNAAALQPGQAYYGNAALTASLQDGSTAIFKTVGDHAALTDLKSLSAAATNVDTKAWGVAILKLRAGLPPDSNEALTLALLGQGTLTNLVDPKLQVATLLATNGNKSVINLYAAPDTKSALIGTLAAAEKVIGNGRTTKSDWLRIVRNGMLAWVQTANVQLDKEIASLAVTDEKDLSPLYAEPMQSITLETPASSPCKDAPNGLLIAGSPTQTARLLIDGAQVVINGAAFVTASADNLTVTSVQNRITVTAAGKSVLLLAGQSTSVPLDSLNAKDKPSEPVTAPTNNGVDLVNSLFNGQAYNGAGSTTAGVAIRVSAQHAVVNSPIRLDLRYTGDASTCPLSAATDPATASQGAPQDVVLAIEASDQVVGDTLSAEQAAVAQFVMHLNPQADQFGVVAFDANALPLSPFGTVLDTDALGGLTVLQPGSTASVQNGLTAALSLIKQSTHSSAAKTIILLSTGSGDPKVSQTAADNLKNDGIRLITIALTANGVNSDADKANRDLLAQLAPNPDDVLIAANPADVRPAVQQALLSLTHPIAVRNLTVTYTLDATHYQLNDDVLALSGGTRIDQNTVSWKLPIVYDSQTIDLPLIVTPLSAGSTAPGAAKLFYETCSTKLKTVTSEAITAPVLAADQNASAPDTANTLRVLNVGDSASGVVSAFGVQTWAVVSKAELVLSVITGGAQSGTLSPTLSGATALYTLRNYDSKQHDLSVFYVPKASVGLLDINSIAANANGVYTLSIQSGVTLQPPLALTVDGDRVSDQQTGEGRVYNIVNSKGDGHLITVVFNANDPIASNSQLPFTVVSLDGKVASTLYNYLDKVNNQWISLQLLHGGGPYYVVTKANGTYQMGVESENTLSSDRGALKVGETRSQVAKNGNPEIFSYTLNVPDAKHLSLVLSGGVTAAQLNVANNQQVAFASQLAVNNFRVQAYDLQPGDYTVYLQTTGDFEIGVSEGDTTASLASLKGPLLLGQTRQEALSPNENFAAYRLVLNANNPLTDGSAVTINLFGQNVSSQNVYIESNDNQRSEVSQDFVDNRDRSKPQLFSVQTLKGSAPYRVRVNGLSKYTIRLDAGDLLSNNKGPLIIGQTARDSSLAPAVLFYDLVPELGKQLVEGDVVTVSFTPQITDDKLFQSVSVSLQNGSHQVINPDKTYVPYQSRQFVSVFTLVGQPPYRLTIPNIGAYTLGLTINDTLDLDQGTILLGATQQDRTNGPQLVGYSFDAPDNQTITVKMADTRKARYIFEPHLVNSDNVIIPERRSATNQIEGSQTVVYVLTGHGPYHLTFEMDGIYEMSIKKGDALTLFQGTFFIGDAETVDAGKTQRVVTYALNLKADQTITVDLRGATDFSLTSPLGDFLQPDAALYAYDPGSSGRIQVYHVRSKGTYELAFSQIGQYTLHITDGNGLIVNKGNAFLGVTENDKLGNDLQSAQYTINADAGKTITVRASIDAYAKAGVALQQTKVLLTDADGNSLPYQSLVQPSGGFIYVYQTQGKAPYTLTFTPERAVGIDQGFYPQQPYTLRVVSGDDLNIDKGSLTVDTPTTGSVDKDTLRRPTYTLPDSLKAGDAVSLSISRDKTPLFVQGDLMDADGNILLSQATGFSDKALIESWQLSGKAPYHFAFNISGDYIVTLSKGNSLVTEQGALTADKPVTATLKAPAYIAAYTLDGKEGDVISLQVKAGSSSEVAIDLRDASGALVFPQAAYFDRGTELYLVKLTGSAPYRMLFPAGNQPYTVTLSGSDVLTAQFGKLPHNPAKSDDPKFKPTVVSSKMAAPARVAVYSIDGKDGDVITLQVALKGGDASTLDPALTNQAGETLDAAVKLQDGSTVYRVYKLHGDGPYTVSFVTTSDHDVTLTDGDVVRAEAGPIPTGKQDKPFSNTLAAPAKIAVHQLDVTAGQLITFQLNAGSKQIASVLRDGSGAVITPEITDFQNGTNVGVYILSGSGPYTIEFPVSGQYTASVMTGDLIRLDNGIAAFGQAIKATLPAPARVGIFTVDGQRDQLVTVAIQANSTTGDIEFRDANGKLWLPIFQFAKSNALYNVYQLGGPPPYTVNFGAQQFTLTVSDGNVVRADQGALTLGQKVANKLTAPAQVAVYAVNGKPGDVVSVQLQVNNKAVASEMRDTDGKLLQRIDTATVTNTNVSVYTLSGKAPYHIEFPTDGQYTLTASAGNALRTDLGKVTLGTPIANTLPAPAQVAIYTIDAQPKQVISIELQVGTQAAPGKLTDADGNELTPDAQSQKGNTQHSIYTLSGTPPYTLTFTATSKYQLTVSNGNVLRKDQGVVRFGNTVTDTLKAPAEIAVYLIDGHVNQVMSVKLQDNNQPLNSQLRDANGVLLQPTGRATANNTTYDVYTLSGQPPYTLTFSPAGHYSLTLTEGTIFNAALGEVPFGTSVTNTLQVPARVAVYTLNTSTDQVISAQIATQGNQAGFVNAVLLDKDGKPIPAQTRIFSGTNVVTYIYTLSAPGPYTFSFEATGQYVLLFTRGDTSIVKLTQFPTSTPTPTPTPAAS